MSTADQVLENVTIKTYTVKAASTATRGLCGVFDSEGVVLDATAGQNASVLFLETKAAGELVHCALLNGGGIGIMKASGTATAGSYATVGTDGVENQTLGGGTTVCYIVGKFTETGVDGDMVGVALGQFASVKA